MRGVPKHFGHGADAEAGQTQVAGRVILVERGGTPACCMILSWVSSMGSNVLAPVGHKVIKIVTQK